MGEEKNIPFIHNYCDHWCEHCAFTARCAVFEAEAEFTELEKDIKSEAFWRKLSEMFSQAKQKLKEKAEEFEINLNAVNDTEFTENKRGAKKLISNESLTKLTNQYAREARRTLDEKENWLIFAKIDEEDKNEMLSIIYWYQYFISAKIQRSLHGILNLDGTENARELNDIESDANLSVKIGLIAVERSIMAWTNLLAEENTSQIKTLLNLLELIKQIAEAKFTKAHEFIRPGFDEIDLVM